MTWFKKQTKLTAMQELIAYVAELKNNNDFTFAKLEDKANELLEKETQNIIEACYYGSQYLPYEIKDKSKQYYNKTFKN